MFLWRISNHADLAGLGGERLKGRWHTRRPGKRIVYLAEHPAVALIENLVNLDSDPQSIPSHFQLLKVSAPEAITVARLTKSQLSHMDPEDAGSTQAIGDDWLASGKSALLRVPSIPSPESWNYLFNPLHRDASKLIPEWARHLAYDQRLFRLNGI
jgi:RES domain-containing protein